MATGWRYRVLGVGGGATLAAGAVVVANHPLTQSVLTSLPVVGQLQPQPYPGDMRLLFVAFTTLLVGLAALWPLFKPRPRRILDTILLTEKRVFLAVIALAAIGYFDYTYRLPRVTLIGVGAMLAVVAPAWFVAIRHRPARARRAILVGDDSSVMAATLSATDLNVIGYVAPPGVDPSLDDGSPGPTGPAGSTGSSGPTRPTGPTTMTDGGARATEVAPNLPRLGGLSGLEGVLLSHEVDAVLLAFGRSDRAEFFGTLATCYDHGLVAKVHRHYADSVLVADASETGDIGEIADVDLDPWDLQDRVLKRAFDVAFAGTGLVVLSPVMLAIAVAVRLDSPGPVFYSQERTAEFGDTFTVYKFRSMVPEAESDTGARLSEEDAGGEDPRVTRVGRILRQTHLDEIPQLWSIFVGDMSVVGPRPERPELDADIEAAVAEWRQRWFVKPGLTGLAQIRGVTGHEPAEKLRLDVEYVRRQSFWVDLKIVIRQLWLVVVDAMGTVPGERPRE